MNIEKIILVAFFFISMLYMPSCTDPCDNTFCINNGTCVDGDCVCPTGFSGQNCEINDTLTPSGNCLYSTGYIKVINNYGKAIRVYIDQNSPNSYNADIEIPLNETRYLYGKSVGTHTYIIKDYNSQTLDQAQLIISAKCDTATISKINDGGGPGTSGCTTGNWGVIKVVNSYGKNIRVYIDESSPNSYNYTMFVAANLTRYQYSVITGTHTYVVMDENSQVLDQAEIHISAACDTAIISRTILPTNVSSTAGGCLNGNWGVIRVVNNYATDVRVYFDQNSPNSYNYDLFIPQGQTRYTYQRLQKSYLFSVANENSQVLDQAELYISEACDTATVGLGNIGLANSNVANGCNNGGWGILKIVNSYNKVVRVYVNNSSPNSYNFNMIVPIGNTRYFYNQLTGISGTYEIKDLNSSTLDQSQFFISNPCDTITLP